MSDPTPGENWLATLLAYGDACGEATLIKQGGVILGLNERAREYLGATHAPLPAFHVTHPWILEIATLSDAQVLRSGRPLNLLVPKGERWLSVDKAAFRDRIVMRMRSVEPSVVRAAQAQAWPQLSEKELNFLGEFLQAGLRSEHGDVSLHELATPASSGRRYLRKLCTLKLIEREGQGRSVRYWPTPQLFLPREGSGGGPLELT